MSVINRIISKTKTMRDIYQTMPEDPAFNDALLKNEGSIANWYKNGAKSFVLSSKLLKGFLDTDIADSVTPDQAPLPFESFMIECDVPLLTDVEGKDNVCHLIQVTDIKYDDKTLRDIILYIEFDEYVAITQIVATHGHSYGDLVKQEGISEETVKKALALVYNFLFYLDFSGVSEKKQAVRKINWVNGVKISQPYIIIKAPVGYAYGTSEESGRHIDVRFKVRGHWRSQACGSNMENRKMIWIMPFWKGPNIAPVSNKPYLVKG